MSASFTQDERIKRKNDFKQVYDQGNKIISSSFILYFSVDRSRQYRRLGITASKKVGNAVVRNRCKRLVREVFRRNKEMFPQGADVIVIVRRGMVDKRYSDIVEELCSIL